MDVSSIECVDSIVYTQVMVMSVSAICILNIRGGPDVFFLIDIVDLVYTKDSASWVDIFFMYIAYLYGQYGQTWVGTSFHMYTTCIFMYWSIHIHAYPYVYIDLYICIDIHTIYIYVHIHIYVCTYMYIHINI